MGAAGLAVKYATTVIELDCSSSYEHNRRREQDHRNREKDIQCPLHKALIKAERISFGEKKRGVEDMNPVTAHHNDIGYLGNDIGPNSISITKFKDIISLMGWNITNDHGFKILYLFGDCPYSLIYVNGVVNGVFVTSFLYFINEVCGGTVSIDKKNLPGFKNASIDSSC